MLYWGLPVEYSGYRNSDAYKVANQNLTSFSCNWGIGSGAEADLFQWKWKRKQLNLSVSASKFNNFS